MNLMLAVVVGRTRMSPTDAHSSQMLGDFTNGGGSTARTRSRTASEAVLGGGGAPPYGIMKGSTARTALGQGTGQGTRLGRPSLGHNESLKVT